MTGRRDLPPMSVAERIGGLRDRMAEQDLPALAVTNLTNVRWLTGFTGSNGSVAVLPDRVVLVTDGRYRDRAADELSAAAVEAEIVVGFSQPEQHQAFVQAFHGLDRIGAEAASLTHTRWEALAADLPITSADGLVEDGRRTKDAGEIARIEAGAAAADAALAEVAPGLLGMTEAEVRMELEYRMRAHGADGPSYDTIVASGPQHAARPHHEAGERRIVEGDTVVIDVGGLVDGYHSDMTRSYVVGREPTDEQREVYEVLRGVQLAGLDVVASGVAAKDVDAACRERIHDAGYGDWIRHSVGHGVGLLIHEEPFEAPTSTAELRTGDVVTVEPGLYRVGFGGFRIEDLVEVTSTGCRILTASPKDTPCPPSPPTT
ncbi:MAG: aminopeptidase P family protein [Ilumatobacter sp.]|nr:aminopeptidase P family protein [Ilumatobacter sp.]